MSRLGGTLELIDGSKPGHDVVPTCDDDTVGSIKTIEKNGGVLESIVTAPDGDKCTHRQSR